MVEESLVKREDSPLSHGLILTKEQKELVKRTVAKNATDDELSLFLHYCQKAGVDPLRRQAHFIKRKDGSTTMMIGIDGFQAKATQDQRYEGIVSQAVHENDEFSLNPVSGEVKHLIKPKNRGEIVGAYAVLKRKGLDPAVVWVDFKEFKQDSWIWKEKPETMITKTARATLLRREYPDVFSGIFEPSEFGMDTTEDGDIVEPKQTQPIVESKPKVEGQSFLAGQEENIKKAVEAEFTEAPKESIPEKSPEPKVAEPTPTTTTTTTSPVKIAPGIIKEEMDARSAFSKIQDQAFQRNQMPELLKMVKEEFPSYDQGIMFPYHIPEKALIAVIKKISSVELKSTEKMVKCKTDGCEGKTTKPEREEQDGLCLKCWSNRKQ